MNTVSLLIYLIFFILGSVLGLKLSYKWHGEIYVIQKIDIIALIMSIIGWMLLINHTIIPSQFLIISTSLAVFLIGFVLEMRPGYGRKETIIGILIALAVYLCKYFIL